MQSEMIGTYFSHKTDRHLFTLLKLENELHEATRFVIRQEIVVKKNQKIS